MYIVKRKNGSVPASLKKSFKSYEIARSAVRVYLRTKLSKSERFWDWGFDTQRNPSITTYGFRITKVA